MHDKISKCYNFSFQNAPNFVGPTLAPGIFQMDKDLLTKDHNL